MVCSMNTAYIQRSVTFIKGSFASDLGQLMKGTKNTISMDLCQHSQTLHARCETDMLVRLESLLLLVSDKLELTQRSSEYLYH